MNRVNRINTLMSLVGHIKLLTSSKVVFEYTNGKSYTALNVVDLDFDDLYDTVRYTTVTTERTPVESVTTTKFTLDLADISRIVVRSGRGTIVTSYNLR